MTPLVAVRELSKHYISDGLFGHRRATYAVSSVSLSIVPGEIMGLVGESGCGKTTLGRAILRLVPPSAGQVIIDGIDVTALGPGALRRFRQHAQMIFQDPYGSLNPRMTVGDLLREPLRIHRLEPGPRQEEERAAELLARVGLRREALSRYPHEFSGGQRQRIGIARALAVRPRFLIADEPVSALDVSIQAQIVNLLMDLKEQEGLTYLIISHDLKVIRHMCDRVAVMYLGRIIEELPAAELSASRHPYTLALLSAVPEPPGGPERPGRIVLSGDVPSPSAPPPGCPFHPRCPRYQEHGAPEICRSERPQLLNIGIGHQVAGHFT
jgi:oligopeptide/dipeptide ABC transporter ATP-binding protein